MASAHSFFQSVDLVMGTTSLDRGYYFLILGQEMNSSFGSNNFTIPKILFENHFVPKVLSDVFNDEIRIPSVVKDVAVFEYTDWENPSDNYDRTKMFIKLMTDIMLVAPTIKTHQLH